mmetsp:Transcript_101706/g.283177  ORF Transcript_101706/g.283177 Transcript_101706/m.283177 type:complete len:295 (-) Transcript_101706:568-1452(-)
MAPNTATPFGAGHQTTACTAARPGPQSDPAPPTTPNASRPRCPRHANSCPPARQPPADPTAPQGPQPSRHKPVPPKARCLRPRRAAPRPPRGASRRCTGTASAATPRTSCRRRTPRGLAAARRRDGPRRAAPPTHRPAPLRPRAAPRAPQPRAGPRAPALRARPEWWPRGGEVAGHRRHWCLARPPLPHAALHRRRHCRRRRRAAHQAGHPGRPRPWARSRSPCRGGQSRASRPWQASGCGRTRGSRGPPWTTQTAKSAVPLQQTPDLRGKAAFSTTAAAHLRQRAVVVSPEGR